MVSEITSGEEIQILYPVYPFKHGLKTLIELPERKVIVATDYVGRIFIWNYEPTVILLVQLES